MRGANRFGVGNIVIYHSRIFLVYVLTSILASKWSGIVNTGSSSKDRFFLSSKDIHSVQYNRHEFPSQTTHKYFTVLALASNELLCKLLFIKTVPFSNKNYRNFAQLNVCFKKRKLPIVTYADNWGTFSTRYLR